MSQRGLRLPEPTSGPLVFESTWGGRMDQKATSLGFGALFWTIWLSLWLPLGTALLWVVAPVYGTNQAMADMNESLPTLGLILILGVTLALGLALWGTVQWVSLQSTEVKPGRPSVALGVLAEAHGMTAPTLTHIWRSRRLVIHHDENGLVLDVETADAAPVTLTGLTTEPESEPVPITVGCVTNVPGNAFRSGLRLVADNLAPPPAAVPQGLRLVVDNVSPADALDVPASVKPVAR